MNEQQPSSTSAPEATSFMNRITNVFMAPSDLYSEVATTPVQRSSWLMPFLISIILVVVATYAVFNNPTIRQQIWDGQEMAMKKQVAKGNMTQDQLEKQMEVRENLGPAMFIIFGAGSASVVVTFMFFGSALVLWLIVKLAFKSTAGYAKVLEVLGLGTMVGVLGTIVTLVIMNLMNSLYATPGPVLAMLSSFDPMNTTHKLIAALNVFTIWEVIVIGIGIAKISAKPSGTGIGLVVGLWLAVTVCWTLLSSLWS